MRGSSETCASYMYYWLVHNKQELNQGIKREPLRGEEQEAVSEKIEYAMVRQQIDKLKEPVASSSAVPPAFGLLSSPPKCPLFLPL